MRVALSHLKRLRCDCDGELKSANWLKYIDTRGLADVMEDFLFGNPHNHSHQCHPIAQRTEHGELPMGDLPINEFTFGMLVERLAYMDDQMARYLSSVIAVVVRTLSGQMCYNELSHTQKRRTRLNDIIKFMA